MPVKIVSIDNPTDAMVITLAEYNAGRTNFNTHYFLANCASYVAPDLTVSWASFYNAINGYITQNGLTPDTVALRFVYCFDTPTQALYMRVQICTMAAAAGQANVYNLTGTAGWFIIKGGTIATTAITTPYDQNYLSSFYYCAGGSCSQQTAVNLGNGSTDTQYAYADTFPWIAEIYAMYVANSQSNANIGNIGFGPCSYTTNSGGTAPVTYPHGTVMFLTDTANNKLINNDTSSIVMFSNKGCDMGTLCPASCNIYIYPAGNQ